MEIAQRIKENALINYKKYGFRSITMDDIAQQLGISKKTIYLHFKDKDTLVDEILDDELNVNITSCINDNKNSTDAIHEIFLALKMIQQTFVDMNPSFLHDLKKYHHKSYLKFELFKSNFLLEIIKKNLERGMQEGLYRTDFKIEVIATMRLESMMMLFNENFTHINKYSIIEVEKDILLHFLYGIASPKGLKIIEKYKNNLIQ